MYSKITLPKLQLLLVSSSPLASKTDWIYQLILMVLRRPLAPPINSRILPIFMHANVAVTTDQTNIASIPTPPPVPSHRTSASAFGHQRRAYLPYRLVFT